VIAAGLDILEAQGPTGLTVRAVCERAHVSAGSVYQYFDTKDALIEAVYRGQLARDWKLIVDETLGAAATRPLREAVAIVVRRTCERQRRLFDLHPGFYRRYAHRLVLGGDDPTANDSIATALRSVFEGRRTEFRVRHVDHAIFLLVRGLSALLRETLLERPEALRDPGFVTELSDLVARYLLGDDAPPA
jgi:AcrR family transcriptional regulator